MKQGICTKTCSPGIAYFQEGREYMVDENDPYIKRHFVFEEEAVEPEPPAEAPKKRAKKQ